MKSHVLTGNRCQCPTCGDYFNSDKGFTRHRVGEFAKSGESSKRRCLTPAEMTAKGWSRNAADFWITKARDAVTSRAEGASTPLPATHVPALTAMPVLQLR